MAITKTTPQQVFSPRDGGNRLGVFVDAADNLAKVKDVNGLVDLLSDYIQSGDKGQKGQPGTGGGIKGEKGESGAQGQNGAIGTKGSKGAKGVGIKGNKCSKGNQ